MYTGVSMLRSAMEISVVTFMLRESRDLFCVTVVFNCISFLFNEFFFRVIKMKCVEADDEKVDSFNGVKNLFWMKVGRIICSCCHSHVVHS